MSGPMVMAEDALEAWRDVVRVIGRALMIPEHWRMHLSL